VRTDYVIFFAVFCIAFAILPHTTHAAVRVISDYSDVGWDYESYQRPLTPNGLYLRQQGYSADRGYYVGHAYLLDLTSLNKQPLVYQANEDIWGMSSTEDGAVFRNSNSTGTRIELVYFRRATNSFTKFASAPSADASISKNFMVWSVMSSARLNQYFIANTNDLVGNQIMAESTGLGDQPRAVMRNGNAYVVYENTEDGVKSIRVYNVASGLNYEIASASSNESLYLIDADSFGVLFGKNGVNHFYEFNSKSLRDFPATVPHMTGAESSYWQGRFAFIVDKGTKNEVQVFDIVTGTTEVITRETKVDNLPAISFPTLGSNGIVWEHGRNVLDSDGMLLRMEKALFLKEQNYADRPILNETVLGDVDNSGSVTAGDALVALRIAVGQVVPNANLVAANVDCSTEPQPITATDALLILRAAVGSTPMTCAAAQQKQGPRLNFTREGSGSITPSLTGSATSPKMTLVAKPDTGQQFLGWEGACTGTGSCVMNFSGNTTLTLKAKFTNNIANIVVLGDRDLRVVPSRPSSGRPITINAKVKNTGPAPSTTPVMTALRIDKDNDGTWDFADVGQTPILQPNQPHAVRFHKTYTPPAPGTYRIQVCVDDATLQDASLIPSPILDYRQGDMVGISETNQCVDTIMTVSPSRGGRTAAAGVLGAFTLLVGVPTGLYYLARQRKRVAV